MLYWQLFQGNIFHIVSIVHRIWLIFLDYFADLARNAKRNGFFPADLSLFPCITNCSYYIIEKGISFLWHTNVTNVFAQQFIK